jgi:hypothetical protein
MWRHLQMFSKMLSEVFNHIVMLVSFLPGLLAKILLYNARILKDIFREFHFQMLSLMVRNNKFNFLNVSTSNKETCFQDFALLRLSSSPMEQTLHTPAYSYTLRDSKPQAFSFQLPNV